MDIDLRLTEAFNVPAYQPKWEAQLLTALGYDEHTFSQWQRSMVNLNPLTGKLYLEPHKVMTPPPFTERSEDRVSAECTEFSEVAGAAACLSFDLKLNARDEVILVESDKWPIILGHKDVVRDHLLRFVAQLQNDEFPAGNRAA